MSEKFDELLGQAESLERELRFEAAVSKYQEAAGSSDEAQQQAAARLGLARCQTVTGSWQSAERVLKNLLESNLPDLLRVEGLLLRAELLSMRGLPEFCGESLKEAHRLGTNLGDALRCTTSIRLAEHLAQIGSGDDSNKLLDVAEVLLERVEEPERRRLKAELLMQRGLGHFRKARLKKASDFLESSLETLCRDEDRLLRAKSLRYLGVAWGIRRQHRSALLRHLDALAIYREASCPFGQAKVYESLGRAFLSLNRLEEAIYSLKRCESLCIELGAQAELATLYGKLGQVYMFREDFATAANFFRKDLAISRQFKNPYALAYSYRNLGQCLVQLQLVDQAAEALQASQSLFAQVDDQFNEARVQMDLCQAYVSRAQVTEANLVLSKAREAFMEQNMAKELAYLLSLEGTIARLSGRFDEAHERLNESILKLSKSGDSAWLAEAYYRRGLLARDQGHRDRAVNDLKNAVRVARRAGLSRETGRYLEELKNLDERALYLTWLEGVQDSPSVSDSFPELFQKS